MCLLLGRRGPRDKDQNNDDNNSDSKNHHHAPQPHWGDAHPDTPRMTLHFLSSCSFPGAAETLSLSVPHQLFSHNQRTRHQPVASPAALCPAASRWGEGDRGLNLGGSPSSGACGLPQGGGGSLLMISVLGNFLIFLSFPTWRRAAGEAASQHRPPRSYAKCLFFILRGFKF